MGKKTMVSIAGDSYKLEHGVVTGSTNVAYGPIKLKFDSKIIAIFYRYDTSTDSTTSNMVYCYYVNPNSKFWGSQSNLFDNPFPVSKAIGYFYNTANNTAVTVLSDYEIQIQRTASANVTGRCHYTAILENDTSTRTIYLLSNTFLYTDGTPTTDVEGAIQTVESNKYKIKVNALVTITDATYVNISN